MVQCLVFFYLILVACFVVNKKIAAISDSKLSRRPPFKRLLRSIQEHRQALCWSDYRIFSIVPVEALYVCIEISRIKGCLELSDEHEVSHLFIS